MKNKRILFYVPGMDVINNGVYYSQVFGLARYAVELGAECLIVYSTRTINDVEEFIQEGVRLIHCPDEKKYVPLPFIPKKYRRTIKPVEQRLIEFNPTHIYIRDPFSGFAALPLAKRLKAKVVFSRRGAGMSTGKHTIKDYVKEGISRFYVWQIFRKTVHLNVVSEYLKRCEARWYRKDISVLPCCIMKEKLVEISQQERDVCRKELDIPLETKVVTYSGGMSHYQCIDEILTLMKEMHDIDKSLVFMLLTQDLDTLNQKLKAVGLPETCCRIRSCRPIEVATYLQSADVAIILRNNDMENRVASPVKIGEYLSSGLGVVASPWIGDVGAMLASKDFAYIFDEKATAEDVVTFVHQMDESKHEAARMFAEVYYTYEGNRDVVMSMFK